MKKLVLLVLLFATGAHAQSGLIPQNSVVAGPTAGGQGFPRARSLVGGDLPALNASNLSSGTVPAARTNGHQNGTATNDSGAAGEVGEFVSSTVLVGSAVALTTGTAANITSISLTAGDWDITGSCLYAGNASTVTTQALCWSSSTSAAVPTAPNNGGYQLFSGVSVTNAANLPSVSAGTQRFSLSGTTTVFLSTLTNFTVSTESAFGFIRARRAR